MKIVSHNDNPDIDIKDVEFQGILEANYDDLKQVFGEPLEGDLYITDAQWKLEITLPRKPILGRKSFPVKVSNFKNGKNYLGDNGLPVDKISNWHISAPSDVKENVSAYLKKYLKETIQK